MSLVNIDTVNKSRNMKNFDSALFTFMHISTLTIHSAWHHLDLVYIAFSCYYTLLFSFFSLKFFTSWIQVTKIGVKNAKLSKLDYENNRKVKKLCEKDNFIRSMWISSLSKGS